MVQKFCWKLHRELNLFVLGVDMTKKEEERRRTKEEEEKNLESSVYTKRCVEREIACVEGEFRELGRLAFTFLSRVEDSWLIFVLSRSLWIKQWAGSCCMDLLHRETVLGF